MRWSRYFLPTMKDTPSEAQIASHRFMLRAGMVLPPEEHTVLIRDYLRETDQVERPKRDNARVVINGSFCEQHFYTAPSYVRL